MTRESAPNGGASRTAGTAIEVEVTEHAVSTPFLVPRRARPPTPYLRSAVRCWCAGWTYLDYAAAHLTLAARATAPDAAAYVRERLTAWLDETAADVFDALADGLVAEARERLADDHAKDECR